MLINHTLTNINQGVSQQHSEARDETQVDEMINCIPDISRGIFRRNPISTISTTDNLFTSNPNFFSYSFNRGDDSKYIVQINSNNQIRVIDSITGSEVLAPVSNTYLAVAGGDTYNNIYDSFSAITIKDFTFIVNRNKTTEYSTTVSGTADAEKNAAIYWVKDITAFVTETSTEGTTASQATVSNYEGYTYTLTNGVDTATVKGERTYTWNTVTEEFDLDVDRITAEDIATEMASQLGANYSSSGPFVYWTGTSAPGEWSWGDNANSSASLGFNGEVADASELPATINDDIISYYNLNHGGLFVYVSGGTDDNIGYWLEYELGVGWKESRKPGMKNTLNASTMPHVLVRDSAGDFHFVEYTTTALALIPGLSDTQLGWKERLYGDTATATDPAFIGSAITDIMFYQNRLTFLSDDSILFSEINVYGNFFPTSIRALVESDYIELTVATQDVSSLRYMVEFADRLIIFSDTTQYMLQETSGVAYERRGAISVSNAAVTIASKFNMTPEVKPVVIGDTLYFISKLGSSSHLFAYAQSSKVADKFVAFDVTTHVPTYITENIFRISGHSTLGYVIIGEYGSNTLYVYNGTTLGEEKVQNAIHKWEAPLPVIGFNVIDNDLYLGMLDGTKIVYGSMPLNTPVDYTAITYQDEIDTVDTDYTSSIDFSEWNVKQDGYGNTRGRLQLRTINYSIDEDSEYTTTLVNQDLQLVTFDSLIKTGTWDDTGVWCDACPWVDTGYKFSRTYTNDEQITVMANTKRTSITFSNSTENTSKGFNLKTLNYEGFYYQRSRRY